MTVSFVLGMGLVGKKLYSWMESIKSNSLKESNKVGNDVQKWPLLRL